ncbi:MAG: hypothetical protein AAF652_08910 [Cyanobacteria bacterium P01_C01_bin.72]
MAVITVTNNSDYGSGTLRQAVLDAQSGDIIKFDPSLSNQKITLSSGLWLNKSLTFDGADAPNLTISGGNTSNIFWMGGVDASLELNVKNLTLADSYYEAAAGGAIYAQENSIINIDQVNFTGNVSDGGAIHAQQGSYITVNNSNFDNNDGASISDKEYATGAISLFAFGELRVSDSTFTNNKGFNGGAIHVTSSDLYVENSTFIGNDSTPGKDRINYIPGAGGAIYADAATVPRDEKFYGLLPEHELQGELEGGVISVNNSYFEKNKASGQGGAMALWGYSQDEVFVTNNVIVDNEVILNKDNMAEGGGVWLMGYGTVENNTIANNRSEDKGGGLFIWGEVPTTVSNTTFANNQAAEGGAIYSDIWDTQLNVNDSNFDANSASVAGGVLYSNKIRPVYIENSQISNNTAADIANINSNSDLSGFSYGASSPPVNYDTPVEQNYTPEPEPTPEVINPAPNPASVEPSDEPNTSDIFIDSGTLKLNSDPQFAGKPDYIPADNTGMYVWQTGNTWNIEVTGDWNASLFKGKIVADQAIQNLTQHSFESNDSVWHTDASRHSVEFSMIVGNDWTDGISFDVAYQADATLYLEMDNGETLPIKVGSSMIGEYDVDTAVAAPAIEPVPEVVYTPPVEQNNNQNHLMSTPISAGLELNHDALFSSKPTYNPSEQSGLIVWNNEDVWHIEATGTPATSHYRGKIVSDQVIEDLSTFSFEASDSLKYADDSHKVVEFSMIVANQWVDGISFKTPDNASVFLELEDSNNVPVQAGAYLQEINLV